MKGKSAVEEEIRDWTIEEEPLYEFKPGYYPYACPIKFPTKKESRPEPKVSKTLIPLPPYEVILEAILEWLEKREFEAGYRYFEENKEALVQKYEGKHIAIWRNEVIDSDRDFSALAQRVYKRLGYRAIYMPLVTAEPRVAHIPSPKIAGK